MASSNILSEQFYSFTGVVEDRKDPQQLGRYRVRVLGIHTDDKKVLPTADLPWHSAYYLLHHQAFQD